MHKKLSLSCYLPAVTSQHFLPADRKLIPLVVLVALVASLLPQFGQSTSANSDGSNPIGLATAAFTVTYDSNAAQHQAGVTSWSPATRTETVTTGTTNVTTAAVTRQGFTFLGWTTTSAGTLLQAGQSLAVTADVTLSAQWEIPVAARLLGRTSNSARTETVVTVSATGNVRGLTTNGTKVFFMPSTETNIIREVNFDGTGVIDHTVTDAPNGLIPNDSVDLTFSSGHIFLRASGISGSALYAISTSDWKATLVSVPSDKPLMQGQSWLTGNLVDFPDGRVGAVSANGQEVTLSAGTGPGQCPTGFYCKVLRLYTVDTSESPLALEWSEDIVLADSDPDWPSNNHGIATDGTYLYQSRFSQGFKAFGLQSGQPSYVVFDGSGPQGTTNADADPCGADSGVSGGRCLINFGPIVNATFFARDHINKRYLMGDYDGPRFLYTESATPPPGPGSSSLGAPVIQSGTVTSTTAQLVFNPAGVVGSVSITNYQYRVDLGPWTPLSPAATSSPVTIDGLTPETPYTLRLRAIGEGTMGDVIGASSNPWNITTSATPAIVPVVVPPTTTAPSTTVPSTTNPPAPVAGPGGDLPSLAPGESLLIEDGIPVDLIVEPAGTNSLRADGPGFSMTLSPLDAAGQPSALMPDGRLRLTAQGTVRLSGEGFAPGSRVEVWVFSEPTYLGELTVSSDGTFEGALTLPRSLATGDHTLQVNGTSAQGTVRSLSLPVFVDLERGVLPVTGSGTSTGTMLMMVLLMMATAALLFGVRRTARHPLQ